MEKYNIGYISKILNFSKDTLRRYEKKKRIFPKRDSNNYRYYEEEEIERFVKENALHIAKKWIFSKNKEPFLKEFYFRYSDLFKFKIISLGDSLLKDGLPSIDISYLISIIGEIGSNSFDHNLGRWDYPGIIMIYNPKKEIILADKGVGLLNTLKNVKPELSNDAEAIKTAFTEIVSGRAPESRGNGLKYVKNIIENKLSADLYFYSGDSYAILKPFKKMVIKKHNGNYDGCMAIIKIKQYE